VAYFIENQQEKWVFCTSIASQAAPTAAELAAGTIITNDIRSVNGFTARSQFVGVPTMQGGFAPKLAGSQQAEDSSLTFAEASTFAGNTIKAALAQGTTGFIVISRYTRGTLVATTKVDVFPVTVAGNNRSRTADNQPAEFVVDFSITAAPSLDATVAA
jgi:hypothetical protein